MQLKTLLVPLVLTTVAMAVVFLFLEDLLGGSRIVVGMHPEVGALLESSLEDQKQLARTDPPRAEEYREKFNAIEETLHHLEIVRRNRPRINRRLAYGLTALFGLVLAATLGVEAVRQRRDRHRLQRLGDALVRLSEGRVNIELGDSGRDTIGRIGRMIEEISRTLVRQRRRLDALANLERWQEAARRQAHELRTPLTAARLEISKLRRANGCEPGGTDQFTTIADGIAEDLDRLAAMISGFAAFAKLPKPSLETTDLGKITADFAQTFAQAWPNTTLHPEGPANPVMVQADRKLLRHVLTNLCENSSRAAADAPCTVRLAVDRALDGSPSIEVHDDAPGISEAVADHLFEPYTSTRVSSAGLGLGLAIARKIMLDHGGDLELISTSADGTIFRMTFAAGNES